MIHGPPGTGKTTTLFSVIEQFVLRKKRVLACAPSNIAVDNIVEKLKGMNVVRLGHPVRMTEAVGKSVCLDQKIKQTGVYKEILELRKESNKWKEIREYEKIAITEVMSEAQVVCCTNTGAMDRVLEKILPNF